MEPWNAGKWLSEFSPAAAKRDDKKLRALRQAVFFDTVERVRSHLVDIPPSRDSIFYSQEVRSKPQVESYTTEICVMGVDTLVAAESLLASGLRPAVLNMASHRRPGGSVYSGSGAQEENLFRRSDLFRSMFVFSDVAEEYDLTPSPHQYPLDRTWGGVYTPQATVFRGTEADGYPLLDRPFQVDFVAVPAVSHPELDEDGMIVPRLVDVTKKKMRQIFRIAIENGNDSLVLSAFGCGAFRNPPRHIAKLFHEVINEDEFKSRFKKIAFAIINDHNAPDGGNIGPFMAEFST